MSNSTSLTARLAEQQQSSSARFPESSAQTSAEQGNATDATNSSTSGPTFSVAQIFSTSAWKFERRSRPSLNETLPLTLYYHADYRLHKAIRQLQAVKVRTSERFHRRAERVHHFQRLLLQAIHLLYLDMDDGLKVSRTYRRALPAEDQRELDNGFSENILFASQAIIKGFRIRGIEGFTHELAQPALVLNAALDAVRFVFCTKVTGSCPGRPYTECYRVLHDFDKAWAEFEEKICFCYFNTMSAQAPGRAYSSSAEQEGTEMVQVLLSETILRAVKSGYMDMSMIEQYDPDVMISIPRLAIVCGLIHVPGAVNMTDKDKAFRWFVKHAAGLKSLQTILAELDETNMKALEWMLVGREETEFLTMQFTNEHVHIIPDDGKEDQEERGDENKDREVDSVVKAMDSACSLSLSGPEPSSLSLADQRHINDCQGLKKEIQIFRNQEIEEEEGTASTKTMTVSMEKALPPTPPCLHDLYKQVCHFGDSMQRGPLAKEFVRTMCQVFVMHTRCDVVPDVE